MRITVHVVFFFFHSQNLVTFVISEMEKTTNPIVHTLNKNLPDIS
jgi:hypothetical protein